MLFPIFVTPLLFPKTSFLPFEDSFIGSVFAAVFVVKGVFSSTVGKNVKYYYLGFKMQIHKRIVIAMPEIEF